MKQFTVPKSAYTDPPDIPPSRLIKVGMSEETVWTRIWSYPIDVWRVNYKYLSPRKNHLVWHISRFSCNDSRFPKTACTCIYIEDGKVVSISLHLPRHCPHKKRKML